MINIEHQQKVSFILLQSRDETWAIIARQLFTPLGGHICALNANVNENEIRGLKTIKSEFWREKSLNHNDNRKHNKENREYTNRTTVKQPQYRT